MNSTLTVVKDQIWNDSRFRSICNENDIESSPIAAQSYLLFLFLQQNPHINHLSIQDPELAYFPLLGRHFNIVNFQLDQLHFPTIEEDEFSQYIERKCLRFKIQELMSIKKEAVNSPLSFSVIIPHFGRPQLIRNILALLAQTKGITFEVAIGDDESPLEDWQHLQEIVVDFRPSLDLKLFRYQHAGAAATRNRLVQDTAFPFLIFLDDDNLPSATMLEQFSQLPSSGYDILVAPFERRLRSYREDQNTDYIVRKRIWLPLGGDLHLGSLQNTLGDMNLVISREVFNNLGGLDTAGNLAAEDWDFLYRGLMNNYKIGVSPLISQIYYDHPVSFFKTAKRMISESRVAGHRSKNENQTTSLPIEIERHKLQHCYQDPLIESNVEKAPNFLFSSTYEIPLSSPSMAIRLIMPEKLTIQLTLLQSSEPQSIFNFDRGVHILDLSTLRLSDCTAILITSTTGRTFGIEY